MPILMQLTIIEYEIGLIRSSRSAKNIIIKTNVNHKIISALRTAKKNENECVIWKESLNSDGN